VSRFVAAILLDTGVTTSCGTKNAYICHTIEIGA